ncbi:MAG TPA: nucleotidyltransferase family protein [Candidatus Altiarchaeales archaeon]|nr:nucleotidyltransferase family protein [Candidatus Altiarchaeales archaeon]
MAKITVNLDDSLVGEIDRLIDNKKIKNRQEAVEHILSKLLIGNWVKKAVILAGGKGTRMRPFTYEMPKPLIPVQGKPLLQYIIELLRKYEIRNIILSTGYLGDKIKEYFGDGNKFGVKIEYVEEDEEMGTAGSLNLMKDKLNGTFLMFNGDVLANIDLHDLIKFHHENRGLATIALTPVRDPSRFGVANLRGNRILEFIEKPKRTTKSKLINAGVYVLEPQVINYVPEGKVMMESDVFPKLAADGKLYGYPFDGQWFDTGTHEAYERAIKEWRGID